MTDSALGIKFTATIEHLVKKLTTDQQTESKKLITERFPKLEEKNIALHKRLGEVDSHSRLGILIINGLQVSTHQGPVPSDLVSAQLHEHSNQDTVQSVLHIMSNSSQPEVK